MYFTITGSKNIVRYTRTSLYRGSTVVGLSYTALL